MLDCIPLLLESDGKAISTIVFSEGELQDKSECAVLLKGEQQLEDFFSGKSTEFDLPLN